MTLAMTLGMSVGMRRTLWMMLGEVLGVACVAVAAVMGVAALMLNYPDIFTVFKWIGGGYLTYLGVRMMLATGKLASVDQTIILPSRWALASQGFLTAIANPKGWAFMISLLPPFLNISQPLGPQLSVLVAIIMCSEFISMSIYAAGGKSLRLFLQRGNNVRWLNRAAGGLLVTVGVWLALG